MTIKWLLQTLYQFVNEIFRKVFAQKLAQMRILY